MLKKKVVLKPVAARLINIKTILQLELILSSNLEEEVGKYPPLPPPFPQLALQAVCTVIHPSSTLNNGKAYRSDVPLSGVDYSNNNLFNTILYPMIILR